MKFSIKTLGCKVNHADSLRIQTHLEHAGHTFASFKEAEYIFINSCTVTNGADNDTKKEVLFAQKNGKKTVLFGCQTKVNHSLSLSFPKTHIFSSEEDLLQYFQAENTSVLFPHISGTRFFLVIQNGCDNACSFCITQKARGKHISIPFSSLKEKILLAEKAGIHEIVITGINLASWGCSSTLSPQESQFGILLQKILAETKIPRIRISSLGPQYLNEDFFLAYKNPRICPHIHISAQSGSPSVLHRMNRGHGTQEIQTLIEKCKKLRPETTVTGDIIAGFPGETEKEHNESKEFLVSAGFHKLHVFPFSLRNDTPAEHIPHHIPLQEKQRRAKEIRDLSDTLFQKWKQENFGKIFEVLVEKNGTGLTPNYFRVNTGDFLANTIQKMVIENDEL